MAGKLTPKQEQFCREYLTDLNATQAAVRAGYSKRTARQTAAENLSKPDIQVRIAELRAARNGRTELSQDWVIERLKAAAEEIGEGSSHSARVQALHLLGKHLGMFADNLNVTTVRSLTIIRRVVTVRPGAGDRLPPRAG